MHKKWIKNKQFSPHVEENLSSLNNICVCVGPNHPLPQHDEHQMGTVLFLCFAVRI